MHVLAFLERAHQRFIAGNMRHDAQFDLRVIRRHDLAARRRDERFANAPPFAGAHRDVLQIRLVRRQAPRHRDGLRIVRMHASRRCIDHARQLVRVRGLELRQPAMFEQHLRQRIIFRELLQHFFIGGRRAARRLLHDRQLQLLEEDLADLLRRTEIEFAAREFVSLRLQVDETLRDLVALRVEPRAIDQHAVALHLAQHARGRHFDVAIHAQQAFLRATCG